MPSGTALHRAPRRIGPLNRGWLAVIGILLIVAGLITLLIGAGVAARWLRSLGLGARLTELPEPQDRFLGGLGPAVLAPVGVAAAVAAGGVLVGLVGLCWLVAQPPRVQTSPQFRLEPDHGSGVVTVAGGLVEDALAERLEQLDDVASAGVALSGTAEQPDVRVRLKIDPGADVPALAGRVRDTVAGDLAEALGSREPWIGTTIVGVVTDRTGRHNVVLSPQLLSEPATAAPNELGASGALGVLEQARP